MNTNLYERLLQHAKSGQYPFHMPGHKRNPVFQMENPYQIDITEIEDFDDLHHPQGILKSLQEEMSAWYKSDSSHVLINGSTCGLLSAVFAVTKPGDEIIIARNCHKSVYNAIMLRELKPHYLYPEINQTCGLAGGLRPQDLTSLLKVHPDTRAVVITSPTYEGFVSDIRSLSRIAHKKGIPLIIDEAHGAHFVLKGYSRYFPESALELGADIVVQSLHKTLPALTQSAVLHIKSRLVTREAVEQYLRIFQTSSPSYVLLAGISNCFNWMQTEGEKAAEKYHWKITGLRAGIRSLAHLRLLEIRNMNFSFAAGQDESKIIIAPDESLINSGITGKKIYDMIRKNFNIQPEMCIGDYVLFITTVCDTENNISRLWEALKLIDGAISSVSRRFRNEQDVIGEPVARMDPVPIRLSPAEAERCDGEYCPLDESEGKISRTHVYLYPPGIPILVPGEEITEDVISRITENIKQGFSVKGIRAVSDKSELYVIKEAEYANSIEISG